MQLAPPPSSPGLRDRDIRAIMLGLMLALMLAALDSTIVAPAMSTIGRDLGDFSHLPWVVTAYLVVSTTLTPLYGKLSDIHGRRIMLLLAISTFVAGSIACALAPSMIALVAARGLQGVGGAGIIAMTMTIVGDIVPVRQRPKYQVYNAIVWALASLAGPVVGGSLAAWSTWRMIFWINVPLGAAAWIATSSRLRAIPRNERKHQLDYLGAALLVCASSLTLLWLGSVGRAEVAHFGERVALVAGAGLCWLLLVWRQTSAAEPLIPLTVLSNRVVVVAMCASGFNMASFMGVTIYVPIFFQTVLGLSVAGAGLATLPLLVASTLSSALAARLMLRMRHYWMIPRIGLCVAAASSLALARARSTTSLLEVEGLMALISFGGGPIFPVLNVSVQAAAPPHELGTSMSLVAFLRYLGASFGVAILGSLILGGVAGDLSQSNAAGMDRASASASFHTAFVVVAAGFMLAGLSLFLAREPSLSEARAVEVGPLAE